jgi:hypothetical protein
VHGIVGHQGSVFLSADGSVSVHATELGRGQPSAMAPSYQGQTVSGRVCVVVGASGVPTYVERSQDTRIDSRQPA